jgi:hypothetical protein
MVLSPQFKAAFSKTAFIEPAVSANRSVKLPYLIKKTNFSQYEYDFHIHIEVKKMKIR